MADEPVVAQANPYLVDVEEGETYFWCQCGKSDNQPFCDGSHEGSGLEPVKFVAERTEAIPLCGCKQTEDPPFCDGTHNII